MSAPTTIPCSKCHRADEVTAVVKEGKWVYTCTDHRPEPHVWMVEPPKVVPKKVAAPLTPAGYLKSVGAGDLLVHASTPTIRGSSTAWSRTVSVA